MTDLEELMAEHQRMPFPDCIETGERYGEVNSVLVGPDIYGWALKASRDELQADDLAALHIYRDRLDRSIGAFPESARGYYEVLLRLATATLEYDNPSNFVSAERETTDALDFDGYLSELDELAERLHTDGWATHETVMGLLANWKKLSRNVNDYQYTIDDFTNDLTSRDALAIVVPWASASLRDVLAVQIEGADEDFRARTVEDNGVSVGRFFSPRANDGWWWRRAPASGPLATYLKQAT